MRSNNQAPESDPSDHGQAALPAPVRRQSAWHNEPDPSQLLCAVFDMAQFAAPMPRVKLSGQRLAAGDLDRQVAMVQVQVLPPRAASPLSGYPS